MHGRLSSACGFAPSREEGLSPPRSQAHTGWRFSGRVSQVLPRWGRGARRRDAKAPARVERGGGEAGEG